MDQNIYIYLILFVIFIIIIVVYCFNQLLLLLSDVKQPIPKESDLYITPNISVKYSQKLKSRGVFANKKYKIGDILEICPTIKVPKKISKPLQDYAFHLDNDFKLFAMGYCGMYNHSDNPNIEWNILENNRLELKVISDIDINEEIYISYGNKYWSDTKYTKL